ncbi:MAG TPA: hypothetical protein VL356_13865 [Acidocella sp.]|jgi:hypothetical protein|nr:hypothetical protein [Acidocella sp.]
MPFKPGKSGNNEGRPATLPELNRALMLANDQLKAALGANKLDAHSLLQAIYRNDEFPLVMRYQAAVAALPYEKPRLSTTVVVEDQSKSETLAKRMRAAQERLGLAARDVVAVAAGEAPEAALIEGTAERVEDYI